MNVLIITPWYPSINSPFTGTFVHDQVKSLIKIGCDVKVICPVGLTPPFAKKAKWKNIKATPKKFVYEGVEVYFPRTFVLPKNYTKKVQPSFDYHAILSLIKNLNNDWGIDIIHAHTAYDSGSIAVKIKKNFQIPFTVTIHGADFQELIKIEFFRKKIINVLKEADAVICVSKKLLNIAKNEKLSSSFEKYNIVYNGIDVTECCAKRKKTDEEKINILCVASLYEAKGHEYLIDAIASLLENHLHFKDKIKCTLVGDGYKRSAIEKQIADNNLNTVFELKGALSHREVIEQYGAADIFAMPSWRESFGIVYLEAMLNFVPVIGIEGQGISEIITDGKEGYLIPEKEVNTLAQRLYTLISDRPLREIMGQAANKKVVENFNLDIKAKEIIQIYNINKN